MADANRFSEQLIDVAERFADVVDSAQGHGPRKGGVAARWLILPAAGAAVYALATSSSSTARKTRGLVRRAKDRATDLPDADLFGRVKEVTGLAEEGAQATSGQSRKTNSGTPSRRRSRTSASQRRRTTSSR
jgi:hypothetical protein